MDDFKIELQDAALLRALNRTLQLMERPRALLDEIGAKLEANVQLRFESKTDPSGVPWPALKPATKKSYAAKYPKGIPGSLLERTRELRQSLAHNTGESVVEIGTSRSVPGKSRPEWQVGFLHEWGTSTMPRRGLLTADPKKGELGEGDQADLLAIVSEALRRAMG